MKLQLFLTAVACVAIAGPAEAGGVATGIGRGVKKITRGVGNVANKAGQAAGSVACAAEPVRQLVLHGLGLTVLGSLAGPMENGHKLPAVVINPGKLGPGFQAGDQVEITVTDSSACRFSVAKAAAAENGGGAGAQGRSQSGRLAHAEQTLEFEVDEQGRALSLGSARTLDGPGRTHPQ